MDAQLARVATTLISCEHTKTTVGGAFTYPSLHHTLKQISSIESIIKYTRTEQRMRLLLLQYHHSVYPFQIANTTYHCTSDLKRRDGEASSSHEALEPLRVSVLTIA